MILAVFHHKIMKTLGVEMEALKITIYARSEKKHELAGACRLVSDNTTQVTGCLESCIHHDYADENRITLQQHWQNRSYLDDYFRSDHFSALLGTMKLLGKKYQVIVNDGTHKESVSIIENARGK